MPLVFRAEGHALALIKAHNLFGIGAQTRRIEKAGAAWQITIDTDQPAAVLKYLAGRMPGIQWTQTVVSP
jgi:hypothetical protein